MKYKKEISKGIRELLRYEWDPIGLSNDGPEDEYDMYAAMIGSHCGNFLSSVNVSKLTNMLYGWETNDMGLSGDRNNCKKVAEKILKLYGK